MAAPRTHYEVLQIDPRASQEVIQGAYRALLKNARAHPDLGGDVAIAATINEAYSVLSDPGQRAAYDRDLARTGHPQEHHRRHAPRPEPEVHVYVRTQYILICPNCRKRNLVHAEDALKSYRCGNCRSVLLPEKRAPQETDPQRAFRLGLFLFDRRMLERARHEFQLSVKLKESNPLYQFWLGRACYETHLYDKARTAFHAAVTIRPTQYQFHFWLGQAAARLKRIEEAIGAYQKALELKPGHAATVLRLASCYFRVKEFDRCVKLLQDTIARDPRKADLHVLLGITYLAQDNRPAAATALESALRLKPGDALIRQYLDACRTSGPLPGLRNLWKRLKGESGAA